MREREQGGREGGWKDEGAGREGGKEGGTRFALQILAATIFSFPPYPWIFIPLPGSLSLSLDLALTKSLQQGFSSRKGRKGSKRGNSLSLPPSQLAPSSLS
jgi:hypothetical protein